MKYCDKFLIILFLTQLILYTFFQFIFLTRQRNLSHTNKAVLYTIPIHLQLNTYIYNKIHFKNRIFIQYVCIFIT